MKNGARHRVRQSTTHDNPDEDKKNHGVAHHDSSNVSGDRHVLRTAIYDYTSFLLSSPSTSPPSIDQESSNDNNKNVYRSAKEKEHPSLWRYCLRKVLHRCTVVCKTVAVAKAWRCRTRTIKLMAMTMLLLSAFITLICVYDKAYSTYGRTLKIPQDTLLSSHPQSAASFSVFSAESDYFSIVINTYRRPTMLRDAVQHYASTCGRSFGISDVFIVWAEVGVTPPDPMSLLKEFRGAGDQENQLSLRREDGQKNQRNRQQQKKQQRLRNLANISILHVPKNSLNSRFLPIETLGTDAVFMVDDDVRVDCKSLLHGFNAWKAEPHVMVGYYPRLAKPSSSSSSHGSKSLEMLYITWPGVYLRDEYNMILTKASFFHSDYLKLYSDPTIHPKAILEMVDQQRNCEDVAMSMLVANQTKWIRDAGRHNNHDAIHRCLGQPIYVEGSVVDLGLFNGISTGTGHMAKRSDCLAVIAKIYENYGWNNPFMEGIGPSNVAPKPAINKKYSYVKLSECSWRRHAPGYWFQNRPSNFFEWASITNLFS